MYETKCGIDYKDKLITSFKKLFPKQKCHNEKKKHCSGHGYHEHCEYVNVRSCYNEPVPEPKEKCHDVPKKVCHDKYIQVPKKVCKKHPKEHCTQEPKKKCHKVPKQSCHNVPKQHCKDVPVKVPTKVAKQVCEKPKPSYHAPKPTYHQPAPVYHATPAHHG